MSQTFSFRPFAKELGKYVNVDYRIVEGEDELDVKLQSVNGIESTPRGVFPGYNNVELYNLALRDYFTNHAPNEFD